MTWEGSLRKHFISTKFSRKFKVEGKKFPSMQQLIGRLLREAQLCVLVYRENNYGGERCSPFTGWVRGPPSGKMFIWGSWMVYFSEFLATREKNFSHEDDTFIYPNLFYFVSCLFSLFSLNSIVKKQMKYEEYPALLRQSANFAAYWSFQRILHYCKYIYHASFSGTGCMSLLPW